jgi:hypothetical protein
MPENKDIPVVDFPFKIHKGYKPNVNFITEDDVRVTLLDYPKGDFRKICAMKILSTWGDKAIKYNNEIDNEQAKALFLKMLKGKTLPNSMESLKFDFLIENMSAIENIYFIRERLLSGIHGKTSGERDIRYDNIIIPNQIKNSKFCDKYKKLMQDAVDLYGEMTDDGISIMQSRIVMPKATSEFLYFSIDLKKFIQFINARKCTQIHSNIMNLIVEKMYTEVLNIIPELEEVLSLKCDKKCFWINAPLEENTRLTLPDKNHASLFDYNPDNYFYKKTRLEMGDKKTIQDE